MDIDKLIPKMAAGVLVFGFGSLMDIDKLIPNVEYNADFTVLVL